MNELHGQDTAREMQQGCLQDILAVLVLYRRDLTTTETFISLSQSLHGLDSRLDLFVYDNSPLAIKPQGGECPELWDIHYHHDPMNPGVSRAYNEGALLARKLGKKWLLLLDQDTVFPEDALVRYCEAVEGHPDVAVLAPVLKAGEIICSPCYYFLRTGFTLKRISSGLQLFAGKAILNSGMLVRVHMFERCGGFNERVKLDFADFVFNNRLKRQCDQFYLMPIQCRHGFSGTEKGSLDAALERFHFFREGAANAAESFGDAFFYRIVVLKRCIRLTLQFRSLRFFACWLGKKEDADHG